MKPSRLCILTILTIFIMLIVGSSSSLAWADPCTATLSYPAMPAGYSNSNVQIVVPISASCTNNYGSQLYATGSAYDATTNTALGSTSTSLASANGGTEFNGQLTFNLPPIPRSDSIQISASIYDSQYGNLITQTSEPVEVGTVTPIQQGIQVTTTTVIQSQYPLQYPSQYPYPTAYQAPYQTSPSQYQSHHASHAHYQSGALAQTSNSLTVDYVVIIAIFAAVIIATASLVLVARRQPSWPPPAPPLAR
jgi:hypothetical protein